MAKGFVIAITIVLILVVMLLYTQNFAAKQTSDLSGIAQLLAGEKVTHAWSDVRDDIRRATDLFIEKIDNVAIFHDLLPAKIKLSDYLHNYGLFIQTYYETPDLDITFLTPGGQTMDLGDIPPEIMIMPQNIKYHYPDWEKRRLFVSCPNPNITAFEGVNIFLNFSNDVLTCTCHTGQKKDQCDADNSFAPKIRDCTPGEYACIHLNINISDKNGFFCDIINQYGSLDPTTGQYSTWHLTLQSGSIDIPIGRKDIGNPDIINIIDIDLTTRTGLTVNTTTALILNTSDFYISYLANIGVEAVNYNTSRIDAA